MKQADGRLRSWLPSVELLLAAVAGALWYTQGGWVEYAGTWPGPWPLLLLALMWVLRWATRSCPSPSDHERKAGGTILTAPSIWTGPLLLFLATAAMGLWAAYDLEIAGAKGWLMVGALGFYWALAHQPDLPRITAAVAFLQLAGAGIAGFFLLTQDWGATPYAGTCVARVAQAVGTWLPPALANETLNPNVAGGILLVVLPLSIPLLAAAWRSRTKARALLVTCSGASFAVALIGWFFTGSRGAHIALIATGCLWLCGRLLLRLSPHRRRIALVALIAVGIITLGIGASIVARSAPSPTAAMPPTSLRNRLWLWQLGASLVRDAPFTGIGLGMFEMPFSLYALLIHVGFVEHSHNLLLNVAIEQGVLGAVSFAVMAFAAFYWGVDARTRQHQGAQASDERLLTLDSGHLCPTLILESTLASLAAIMIHGLVDDPLYSSRGILLLLVPFGLLAALERTLSTEALGNQRSNVQTLKRSNVVGWPVVLTVALTVAVIGGIVSIPVTAGQRSNVARWQAAWHANLGVLMQTRVELTAYDQHHFSELSIGDVRRQEDLTPAGQEFNRAAALDPGNVTARRRQTMVALAHFNYDEAFVLMQATWDAGHRDRVTRLLYGDVLVAYGRVDEAAGVVQGLPFAQARLLGQAWGYQQHDDLERADYARQAAQLVQ